MSSPDSADSLSDDQHISDALLRLSHDALQPFDVDQEERQFLSEIFALNTAARSDRKWLVDESLVAGAESWDALVDCARSLRRRHDPDPSSLEGNDVLAFLWYMYNGTLPDAPEDPWYETDRLLSLARERESESRVVELSIKGPSPGSQGHLHPQPASQNAPKKRKKRDATSHYWDEGLSAGSLGAAPATTTSRMHRPPLSAIRQPSQRQPDDEKQPAARREKKEPHAKRVKLDLPEELAQPNEGWESIGVPTRGLVSPYFSSSSSTRQPKSPSKRAPPGTLSCIPFPPLDAPHFGLVQEKVAHQPFWLLVAVTFLIRTKGTAALPVFYAVKSRFPTPDRMADPANAGEITEMIRHLGLAANRLGLIQKYARLFMDNPPRPGRVYRVRNYDSRDMGGPRAGASLGSARSVSRGGMLTPGRELEDGSEGGGEDGSEDGGEDSESDGWEIGHMTQGKYAIDSWRIFCRDQCLGRAADWNGACREPEFQPEWMRVRPDDKELRAYLRWMWMREGWEWDPETGSRRVLRGDLARAVNERRVEYDDRGGLRMLERPRAGGD